MSENPDQPLDPSERELLESDGGEVAPAEAPAGEEAPAAPRSADSAEEEKAEEEKEELSPEELDRLTSHCPHCGAARQAEDFGSRFCSTCGLSVWSYAGKDDDQGEEESDEGKVRCRHCGVRGLPPRCTQCGHMLSFE